MRQNRREFFKALQYDLSDFIESAPVIGKSIKSNRSDRIEKKIDLDSWMDVADASPFLSENKEQLMEIDEVQSVKIISDEMGMKALLFLEGVNSHRVAIKISHNGRISVNVHEKWRDDEAYSFLTGEKYSEERK